MHFTFRTCSVALLASAILASPAAFAQDDAFRATLRAKCRVLDENGRLTTAKITERDIIRSVVGTGESSSSLKKDYALVYNQTADSLQVVRLGSGEVLGDVLQFSGGTYTSDTRRAERLTFLYLPGFDESIGTAILTEKLPKESEATPSRLRVTGTMQFVLSGDQALGGAAIVEEEPQAEPTVPVEETPPLTDTNNVPGVTNIVPVPGGTNGVTVTNLPGATNGIIVTNVPGITNGAGTTNVTIGTGTAGGTISTGDTNLLSLTPVVPGSSGTSVETNRLLLTPAVPGAGTPGSTTFTNTVGTTNTPGAIAGADTNIVVGGVPGAATGNNTNVLGGDTGAVLEETGGDRFYVYSEASGVEVSTAANPDVSVCTGKLKLGKRVVISTATE